MMESWQNDKSIMPERRQLIQYKATEKAKNVMRKIWNIFQSCEALAAVVIALIIVAPMTLGIKPYVVISGSMEPVIHTGAMAFVDTKANAKSLKKGDIVTFKLGENKIVTHRIYRENSDGTVRTKGDANKTIDLADISRSQIIGKEKYSIPFLGRLVLTLRSRSGIIAVATIVACNVIISLMIGKEESEEKESEKENE